MKRFVLALAMVTSISIASPASSHRVRISVAGLFHSSHFTVLASSAQPLLITADGHEFTLGAGGPARVLLTRRGTHIVLESAKQRIICDSVSVASPQNGDSEFTLTIPRRFDRTYRGRLTIIADGRELRTVVEMDLETAVASAVAAESPPGAPLEALKAQAVVSRSYFVAGGQRHPRSEFCDTTHCQFVRNPPAASSLAARAAHETEGMVLTWNGRVFPAFYSARCGGRTRTLTEHGSRDDGYPYFAVECAHCLRTPGKSAGHGMGLCQQGAASMAWGGESYRNILDHYFPNTVVRQN